jgi:hypothetical protein
MANPLARVVMNNVIKKTNDNPISTNPVGKNNNLTNRDEEILIGLMKGEKEAKEDSQKATVVSLDEAAEIARGRK